LYKVNNLSCRIVQPSHRSACGSEGRALCKPANNHYEKEKKMNGDAYYSNKGWARKAMTILVTKMCMFQTIDRTKEHGAFGEYELGVKFYVVGQGWVEMFPVDQSDLNEIADIVP
jgi:hypothetical protein